MKYFLPTLFFILMMSCSSSTKKTATYFGGKIINPKSNYVILFKIDKAIDTFYLDKKNKFFGKLKGSPKGLYYFVHGNEHQYLFLEPNDSLLFRLNTWDFDESLVFSGKGAERNNLLIDNFLESEKENKKFYKNYKLSPSALKLKIDSLKEAKLKKYDAYIDIHPNENESFKKVLYISLIYPLYNKLELYPRLHRSCEKDYAKELENIANSFYKHRKTIDINNDTLMYYIPYANYVTNYLYNLAYTKTQNFSPDFTVNLLQIINKKLTSEKIKNELLYQTVVGHFYNNSTCNDYNKAFFTFFKTSTNIEDKKTVQRLLNDTKIELENKKLSNFKIRNLNGGIESIADLIKNKKTLLLFWTRKQIGEEYLASRVKYLQRKFPNIQFLLINIDKTPHTKIKRLDIKTQFYIDSTSTANKFLTSKLTRTILVNSKGVITNSYASLFSNRLLKQLKSLSKN